MKLVSEQDPKEIAAQHICQQLSATIRIAAANLLRIIAGAGENHQLVDQIRPILSEHKALELLTGNSLRSDIAIEQALRSLDWRFGSAEYRQPTDADLARRERDGSANVERAKNEIVQAVLRLVAAQLCADPTQESRSNEQLIDAIRRYNEAREAHRSALLAPKRSDEWSQ